MGHAITLKKQRSIFIAKAFLILLLAYLLFHLFVSERSIPTMLQLSAQEQELSLRLATLKQNKDDLAMRVTSLRPETLDPDLVEEYAIQMLGRGVGDELIILN
jgi:cell division protein FtsB